jgi:hypothetical protein
MRPAEAFLSHASADRQFASELAEILRRHGLPVWYSETDIRGAQQWHDEIGAALGRCDWFLLVLTPAAVESMESPLAEERGLGPLSSSAPRPGGR